MEALLVVGTLLFAALMFFVFLCFRVLTEIHSNLSKLVAASSCVVESLNTMDSAFFRHSPFREMQEFFVHVENQIEHIVESRLKQDVEEFGIFSVGFVGTPDYHRFCEAMDLHSKSKTINKSITERELLAMLVNCYISELSLDELNQHVDKQ